MAHVVDAWWPLASSWILMAVEQPAMAAVVARLPAPEINLGAYGVVFPLALVIEAPIIMLLAASTELSRDRASYRALRTFSNGAGLVLTVLHLLLAATPMFDLLVGGWLGVPDDVADHARWGLLLMLPWAWSIASRRTGQGVLIRYGHARAVGKGTVVRLLASALVLTLGLVLRAFPGVVVAASALSTGVLAEAAYVGWRVRPIVRQYLGHDDPSRPPLRGRAFREFYVPLAMMPLVVLTVQPIGTAAITRMPAVVESLAVWPVLSGAAFVLQSIGIAYNEVVVAKLDRPRAGQVLSRFAWILTGSVTAVWVLLAATPLSEIWFGRVSGLAPSLTAMAVEAVWIALPIPATRVLQSYYQGILVHHRKTRAVTEAVVVFAVVCVAVLLLGVRTQTWPGLFVATAGFAAGRVAQTLWLMQRTRALTRT